MKKYLKPLVGLPISIFFLWLALRNFNLLDLRNILKSTAWGWFFLALLVYIFGYILRTIRWKILLSPLVRVKISKLFPVLTFGFLINNILPARAGELARAFAARHLTKLPAASCFGSIALERLTDFFGLGFFLVVAAGILPTESVPLWKIFGLFLTGVAVMGLLFGLIRKYTRSIESIKAGFLKKVLQLIINITDGFVALKSFKRFSAVLGIAVLVWGNEVFSIFLFSKAFGLNLTYVQAAALIVGLSVGVMIPAAPGYVGTYEFFGKKTLVLMGFAASLALPFVLVVHFVQFLTSSLLGLPYLFKIGMDWKKE